MFREKPIFSYNLLYALLCCVVSFLSLCPSLVLFNTFGKYFTDVMAVTQSDEDLREDSGDNEIVFTGNLWEIFSDILIRWDLV